MAHRMGLIPLKADPRLFQWKAKEAPDEGTEQDTLEFSLNIRCRYRPIRAVPQIFLNELPGPLKK